MTRRLTYFVLFLAVCQATCLTKLDAQADDESISARRVGACHIEQAGAYHALADIAAKANIAVGVEAIRPESEPSIKIDFPGGTVADLMNAFVTQAPDYSWAETARGIVHVSRTKGHIGLLDVVIDYPGAQGKTRQQIWEDIATRPEVSAWMRSSHCTRGELLQGGEFRNHNGPVSIPPGDRTVQKLLDEVTLKSGENFWAILQSPKSSDLCRVAIILW